MDDRGIAKLAESGLSSRSFPFFVPLLILSYACLGPQMTKGADERYCAIKRGLMPSDTMSREALVERVKANLRLPKN